ncbi:hypothetical protein [Sphingobacterium mizutaii]|uniref:hypothetical protein n=1 Tax=Sphingobacterium mizutaii TaxID=1010 RepID=UPI001627F085|nr:hypothetical protein [Sphingobacterium mizutaii]
MAITINQRPHLLAPLGNNNIWSITSDITTLVYVLLTVKDGATGRVITKKKLYIKPNSSFIEFDLKEVLKDSINNDVVIGFNTLYTILSVPNYQLEFNEYFINNDVLISGNTFVDDEIHYYFNGELNPMEYARYSSNVYNLNQNQTAKYLTNHVDIKQVEYEQKESLSIFNVDGMDVNVIITCYNNQSVVGTITESIEGVVGQRIDINMSPSYISSRVGEVEFSTYKIELVDTNNKILTKEKFYQIEDDCKTTPLYIYYKNDLGGWDSVKLNNPIETFTTTKNYLNSLPSFSSSKFNNAKKLINKSSTYSYTAFSELLNDNESLLIRELISSSEVYVVIDEYLVEVIVDSNKYKVLQRHTNAGKKGRFELTFTSPFSLLKIKEMIAEYRRGNIDQLNYIMNNFWSLVNPNNTIKII